MYLSEVWFSKADSALRDFLHYHLFRRDRLQNSLWEQDSKTNNRLEKKFPPALWFWRNWGQNVRAQKIDVTFLHFPSHVNTWYSNLGILILQSYTLVFFSEQKWVTSIMFIVSQWLMKCHLPDGSNYHLLMAWHGALLCEDRSIIDIWGNNFISQFELILIHARLLKNPY